MEMLAFVLGIVIFVCTIIIIVLGEILYRPDDDGLGWANECFA